MTLYRPVAALISLLFFPTAAANVRSVSVVSASGRAEVVIGTDAAVEVQHFTLDSPARVIVDLKGATLDMKPHPPGDKSKRQPKRNESLLDTNFQIQTYVARTTPYVPPKEKK